MFDDMRNNLCFFPRQLLKCNHLIRKEELLVSFAEKLKTLREKNNMTQEEVASRLKVARSTIAGYENETKKRQPSQECLAEIAKLFSVSVDYLVNDEIISIDTSMRSSLSREETELLAGYRRLSLASRELVTRHLHLLEDYDINYKKQQQP